MKEKIIIVTSIVLTISAIGRIVRIKKNVDKMNALDNLWKRDRAYALSFNI